MSGGAPPLRFLALVLGGWVCVRAAMLAPVSHAEESPVQLIPRAVASSAPVLPQSAPGPAAGSAATQPVALVAASRPVRVPAGKTIVPPPIAITAGTSAFPLVSANPPPTAAPFSIPNSPVALLTRTNRWSVSVWAFLRQGDASQLATGGILGGSQAGARVSYAVREGLALSGRFYAPLRSEGAEAALGLEWQPSRVVPIKFLAERRQALGESGRSAFALMAYGGVSEMKVTGPVRLDAFAQAGVVGLRSRDMFVDGSVRVGVPITRGLSAGAGLWGAAQPGVSRLDAGPQVSLRLPIQGSSVRLSADWRFRLAGDAEPGSGPALTVSTDF